MATRRAWVARAVLVAALLSSGAERARAAEVQLDGHIERAAAWSLHAPDGTSVSVVPNPGRPTPRALLLEWPKSLGEMRDGVPSASQVPSVWIRLPESIDLARFTTLRLQARIEGPRHGFLHVVVATQPWLWGSEVRTHIDNFPLEGGGWQEGTLSLDLVPEEERRAMRWLGFASVNVGHHPDEPAWLRTFIDEVVLGDEPPPPRRGWAADPGQVIVSRLGFRSHHEKWALVDGAHAGARFELLSTGGGEAVAHSGTLRLVESVLGRHAVADFTELTTPGEYRVRAAGLQSLPFRIGEDANRHSLDLLADWVHAMRCGQETALHPACHLDDALYVLPAGAPGAGAPGAGASSAAAPGAGAPGAGASGAGVPGAGAKGAPSRRSLPLSGGWHDAGDVRTYYSYSHEMAWRWLRARDAGRLRDRDGDGVDDFLDGARWALSHAVRLVDPVSGGLFDKIDDRGDFRRGNHWTDNRRGSSDDRQVKVADEVPRHVASLAASAGLMMRRASSEQDRALAREAVALAERRLAAWVVQPPPLRPGGSPGLPRPKLQDRHGHVLARFGLGALQLHLATGRPEHLLLARSCSNLVLALQSESFLPGATRELGGDIFSWAIPHEDGDLPELFLAELLIELPDDQDAPRRRAALRRVAQWWLEPTRELWGPFSLPSLVVPSSQLPDGPVAVRLVEKSDRLGGSWLLPSAGRQQLADTALALHRIAQALDDPELERLARRQIHWAFGYNPFGVSWIVRHDDMSVDQLYSFSQGPMPGAVSGYGMAGDGEPRCYRPAGGEPVTHAAAELLAAAVALTEPARFAFEIVDAGRPWEGEAVVTWERTGGEVLRLRTGDGGRLPEVALDGGERYRLRLGEVELALPVVGGRRIERLIDRHRLLSLRASVEEPPIDSRPFTVSLRVSNEGLATLETTMRVYVEGAFATQRELRLELQPGEERILEWPLRAKTAGRPFIATFRADGLDTVVDVSAAIRPRPAGGT